LFVAHSSFSETQLMNEFIENEKKNKERKEKQNNLLSSPES